MLHRGKQLLFTDLLLSMENPSMDSMNFGVLGANLATFQSNSPNLSPPRCVSSETDLGSGDGDCGGETEEGDLGREVGMSRLTNDLDPYGSASTGIEEPTSQSDFGTGDGDGGGESEGTEHLEVSMSRTSYHIDTDVSFSPRIHEPLLADTTDNCSPDSPRPWKKRRRCGKIPDFREPLAGRKTAIEGAIRMFGDRDTAYVMAPKIGMEFDSLQEAYDFYNLYSWEIGFGIRYGPYRKNPSNSKIGQDIVCGCSGKPRHLNSKSVSCGCQAMIRLHRTADHGWFIVEFRTNHNHGFSVTCGEKMHWPSHRSIDPHTKALVTNLRDNNVGLTKVLCVIGSFFGSMEKIPFNKRSLRSLCASISRDHCDDDVKKTCDLFSELKMKDPNFVDSVLSDKEGNIRALMWTNGKSRMQYKSFGDAITFDTTYRTNRYEMPFGLFVGVNNHFQSIILGGVLLTNETKETFEWVFKEFVNLMGGKAPVTILTDQCRAMELAIIEVLPDTAHRWCKWHVLRKANECLGTLFTRNEGFRDKFHKICEYMLTVEEFEAAWADLIDEYNLHDNPFLTQVYDIRNKWAKPYFSGIFCARMTSTQRSESANHMLKNFVPPGSPMNMFVRHYQKLQFDRDSEESFQEKRCRVGRVLLSSGGLIEKHASKVYTPAMYDLFGVALFQSASYIVQTILGGSLYIATHVDAEKRERWSRISYQVRVEN